ncbi:hypothetical protein CF5_0008 [Staphylococcus phage CF5]|uniref:Uncharacterized protein n=1 Tax=Staphylococcus phage CF5 TaxID=3113739 RepID=A0AAX4J7X6_9CAUD|nr:hypothetical protein CF5_0008 [Staphylococcus phage CF5]
MKLMFKDTNIDTGCIVYNSFIEDFGVVIRQNDGYNILCINRDDTFYNEVGENYLIYSKEVTLDKIKCDNKAVPNVSIV